MSEDLFIDEDHLAYPDALGHHAVRNDIERAEILTQTPDADYYHAVPGWEQAEAAYYDSAVHDPLDKVRAQLDEMLTLPETRRKLNQYLNYTSTEVPDIFWEWRDKGSGSWPYWLKHEATDDQLLNFLQWHNHKLQVTQNSEEVINDVESTKAAYESYVAEAVADDWLPERALSKVRKLHDTKVMVGDAFDEIMQSSRGYHYPGSDYVVLGKKYLTGKTPRHEFNHAVLGKMPFLWLDEAVTEHVAQKLPDGSLGMIDPYGHEGGAYPDELDLLQTVVWIASGRKQQHSAEYEQVIRTVLSRYVDETYPYELEQGMAAMLGRPGERVLFKITSRIHEYHEQYKESGMGSDDAMRRAVRSAHNELLDRPEVLFAQKQLVTA